MANPVNDRDLLLQGATSRVVDVTLPANVVPPALKAVTLSAPSSIFRVATDGTSSPAAIVLAANLRAIAGAPTMTWSVTPVGAATLTGSTYGVRTLAFANMAQDYCTIRVEVNDGGMIYFAELSFSKVRDGSSGVPGRRGSISTARAVTGATWSDAQALQALADLGISTPLATDTVTLYNASVSYAEMRRYDGTAWVAAPASLPGSALMDGSLGLTKFASGLEPVKIVASLPTSKVSSAVFLTTDSKLYRWNGSAYTADVDGADIVANSITSGQIQAGAVTADELAASAVTADKLAARAVTADKLTAGAVTTEKLLVTGLGMALNPDPNTQDITAWTGTGLSIIADATSPSGGSALECVGFGATVLSQKFPIDPTKNYKARLWTKQQSGSSTSYGTVAFYDASGAVISGTSNGAGWPGKGSYHYFGLVNGNLPAAWTEYSISFGPDETAVLPSNARFMAVGVLSNYTGSGVQRLSAPLVHLKTTGDMVVDGSLMARHIDTEGLTIKQNGQVILGAGTSLPSQFVMPDGGWLNSNLVPSIDAAATTAIWSNVSGTGRPADGATAGSNLIKKSVFTDGSMGGWNANLACAGCYGGASEIQTTSRDTLEIDNIFVVTPGETLYAAGDVYTLNSDYGATVGAAFIDAAGNYISWQGAGKGPREPWSRVYGTLIAPANAVFGIPWIQINGPGGEVLPYVAYSRLYLGRQQEGATVGAPTGTYVGDTLAQNVESLAGAQVKADAAANWAISAAQTYAAAQAELARINANAHADGIVTAAEQRSINDASAKAEAARVAAVNAAAADATAKASVAAIGDNLFVGNLANVTGAALGAGISVTEQTDPRGGATAVNVLLPNPLSYVYYKIFNQEGRAPGWYVISLKLLVAAGMSIVVSATDASSWDLSEYKVATTTSTTPTWVTCVIRQYVGANSNGLDVVIGAYHKGAPISSVPSYTVVRVADLYVYADRYEGDVNATNGADWNSNLVNKPKTFIVRATGGSASSTPESWWTGLRDADTGTVFMYPGRSYILMDFDRLGNPVGSGVYDVYGSGEYGGKTGQDLANDLNWIATNRKGNIVVVFTADEPCNNRMSYGLPDAMYRCGASKAIFGSSSFRFRGAYILVGVAGCGEGNGAEIYAGAVDSDPNAWCELTFSIQNGSLNVSGTTGSPKSVKDFDYTGALDANNTYLSGGAIYGVSGEPGTSVSNGLIGINASGELYGAGAGNGIKISNNQVYISDGSIYGIGGGAGTKIDNSYQAIGQNLIPNSDQTHTPCFGGLYNPNSATIEHVNSYASDRWGVDNYVISGSTTRNLSARQLGVASGGDYGIAFDSYPTGGWGRDFGIPVVAGTRYMFSCYFASHRCRFNIGIGFWDAAGNSISYAEGVAAGPTESAANSLERYIRVSVAAVAPSGAVTVTAHIRKYNSFSWAGDSYIWYAAPMLEAVSANATEPSPYMPGPAGNTRQLGYVGDLNATVGAPAGTYVGSTPAQNVESQAGAQARADAAANWAVSTAQTYAAAKADLARINAEAHADGQVSAAEQRAIADASNKAEAARVAAVNAAAADATAKANVAATTANWSGVAQRPMDISNLIRKGTFDDGQPGAWSYAGIENRINGGMPYAKNIYFHTRDNLENGSDFPVTPGETIYAAAWFETQGITDYPCYLGLRVSDAFGNVVQWLAIAGISPNTGWRYVTGSGVIAANAASAAPWVQMAGFDFPANYQWLRASGLWLGRHAPGATVGAPAGTYVGDTLAQNVESQSGAQYRADVARAGAIGVASEDASAKANWARNAAVGDVTPSINAKLNKAGDTISGRISFAVADGMFAGSDTNNGVYFGKDGLVGRKGGANTFYINTAGDAVFSGSLDAATMNSGVINLQHNGGWEWGYVRSHNKWWGDGQNGWVLGRHANGDTFMEMRGGSNRFWMSSWSDCGIQFPGISMTNGGLTIDQLNVINTANISGNAVTIPTSAYTDGSISLASGYLGTQIQSVSFVSSGTFVYLAYDFFVSATGNNQTTVTLELRIWRNSTLIRAITVASSTSINDCISGAFTDTPGSGAVNYQLTLVVTSANSFAGYVSKRSLFTLETKR